MMMKPRRTTVILLLLFLFCLLFQGWLWWYSMKDYVWIQRSTETATWRVGVAEGTVMVLEYAGIPSNSPWGRFEISRVPWSTYVPHPPAVPAAWRIGSVLGQGSKGIKVALWAIMLGECALFLPFMGWRYFRWRRLRAR